MTLSADSLLMRVRPDEGNRPSSSDPPSTLNLIARELTPCLLAEGPSYGYELKARFEEGRRLAQP